MKTIFLDFDGVLNPQLHKDFLKKRYKRSGGKVSSRDRYGWFFDPYCVDNLAAIVDITGAQVVVVSSWRIHEDIPALWMDRNMPGHLIGVTPSLATEVDRASRVDNAFYRRGEELDMWMKTAFDDRYVILDDHNEIYKDKHQKYIVHCNKDIGLTSMDADKAVRILA